MKNLRKYGNSPFRVAVIHGGPGAPGEMAPLARELSSFGGALEPLQTKPSLEGQVRELKTVLDQNGDLPVTLVGWSWGAWLSFIIAARFPSSVRKLILIGSGPFEDKDAAKIMETRLSRLNEEERRQIYRLMEILNDSAGEDKNGPFAELGRLISRADSYDPISPDSEVLECQYHIYQSVWREAAEVRRSGKLLELAKRIRCPVVAIHGDYDPHPYEGVREPLSLIIKDFSFFLLKDCGHHPWIERTARDRFYNILKEVIS